jgi:hypothetical protein
MAGKHRVEGSSSSNKAVKVAGLAGIAVTASLMSAGSAQALPFFHGTSPTPNVSPSALHTAGGGFFTAPSPNPGKFPFGNFITKTTTTAPTSGIGYITAPGPLTITGFCLNRRGCN